MADTSRPAGDRQLIAVYETLEQAYAAAGRARQAGAPDAFVGEEQDHIDSLRAEMREELEHALIAPTAALVLPKESLKGVGLLAPVGMVVGALLALPFAWIDWGVPFTTGLIIVLVCGAAMGATVAFLVGAGTAMRGRFEANAADQGVTVRVPVDTPEIEHALDHGGVLRLDRVDSGGNPDETLATEADHQEGGVVEDMAGHIKAAPHVAGINDESDPDYDPDDPGTSPSIERP